jgi:hypothetical protein
MSPVFAMTFRLADFGQGYQVQVGAPWKLSFPQSDTTPDSCLMLPTQTVSGCVNVSPRGLVTVWTTDPTAPARNITITSTLNRCM